jgi:hypothetical protein
MAKDIPHPDELIGSRAIIQGASGAGKTFVLRRILEETHGLMQHLVLDVEDEMHTLREKFDYALIGGENADAPITVENAAAMAHGLLDLRVSAIVQLNDVGLAAQRAIIAAFVAGLMSAPRALWHPVLVTLDEAHRYAPQAGSVASSEPLTNLATAGRKRPFGALFATQRLSMLSKDILGQCPNRIMGRVDQSLDRRAAADMLGFPLSSPEAKGMMGLKHEFWVVGPAFGGKPRLHKFSSPITTHLQPGRRDAAAPATPAKVKAMLGRLAALAAAPVTSEKAKSSSDRGHTAIETARVATDVVVAVADTATLDAARKAGYRDGWAACEALAYPRGVADGRRLAIEEARKAVDEALEELGETADGEPPEVALSEEAGRAARVREIRGSRAELVVVDDVVATGRGTLSKPFQRIVDGLALLESAGLKTPGRHQVGWAARYRADAGHFGNILGEMEAAGLIERGKGTISLTGEGRAHAIAPPIRLTAKGLLERIMPKLSAPAGKLLQVLFEAYPKGMTRAALGEATGYRADAGHFGNLISELTAPEIATRERGGEIRLSDWVMLK